MSTRGFAVIDLETTGLFAQDGDRIVEVAVVHVDADGRVTGSWDTLVEPLRDLGSSPLHGLSADDLIGAPTFEQVAPRLVELLDGRTIVAHNAAFHLLFLRAEFERAGLGVPEIQALCTMRLAREFLPGVGRSLEDCCDSFDIVLGDQRSAAADAGATAQLLGAYLLTGRYSHAWASARPADLPAVPAAVVGDAAAWMPRAYTSVRADSFLQRITVKLPEFAGPADQLDYLALLDRCMLDRDITTREADQLVALAEILGISRPTVVELHHQYFDRLEHVEPRAARRVPVWPGHGVVFAATIGRLLGS